MKTNFKIIGLIALLAGMPFLLSAQEKNGSSLPREVPSPEKMAKRETDEMNKQLQLTEKQYKKIYELNLKEQKKRFSAMQNSERQEPPMGGRPGGMDGRRPPMMGGEPPMMGGAGPDRGGHPRGGDKEEEIQKAMAAKQKKIKKILTTEQYEKWQEISAKHKERHPGHSAMKEKEN